MTRSIIKSTGRFVPDHHVTNHDLAEILDTSDEWIRQRTGIEARYWVKEGDDVGTSDLAFEASKIALERAGWEPADLDLIVMATMTSDVYVPGAGVILQHRLGAKNVPALDIRQQCTGFLHGLELCDAYIQSGKAQKILMVGAETQSRFLELTTQNRDTAVIFADGAGAACIEAEETNEESGILASVFHADGKYADILTVGIPVKEKRPGPDCGGSGRTRVFPLHGRRNRIQTGGHLAASSCPGVAGKSRYPTGSSGHGRSPPGQSTNQ